MNNILLIFINIFAALLSAGLLTLAAYTHQHACIAGLLVIISSLFSWVQDFEISLDLQVQSPPYPLLLLAIGIVLTGLGYLWEVAL